MRAAEQWRDGAFLRDARHDDEQRGDDGAMPAF